MYGATASHSRPPRNTESVLVFTTYASFASASMISHCLENGSGLGLLVSRMYHFINSSSCLKFFARSTTKAANYQRSFNSGCERVAVVMDTMGLHLQNRLLFHSVSKCQACIVPNLCCHFLGPSHNNWLAFFLLSEKLRVPLGEGGIGCGSQGR